MHVEERKNKNGEIISYRLFYSGVDPKNNRPKVYTKTWKIPTKLTTKKEIQHELLKVQVEFEKESESISNGTKAEDNNIMFVDYANEWLNNILVRNPESYTYYIRAKENLKIINPYFSKYLLKNISPTLTQSFYDYLCNRTYKKQIVVVKKSILNLMNNEPINHKKLAENIGINRLTLRLASKIGQVVSIKTAKTICKYFNVPLNNYFNIETKDLKYSKATNSSIRTTLVVILGEAKRQRLIEHNFASREFTKTINGTAKEKTIFDENEAREFVKKTLNLDDYRKKTAFSLLIFLGLRKSEIAGLEWDDIDFANNCISINRNSIYVQNFNLITKKPKTINSRRTLSMPQVLVDVLKEYKSWWDTQKQLHGDLWQNSRRLFLQTNGNPLNPHTINTWLDKFELDNDLKHVPPHSLRHTAVTLQINANIPLKVVSQRMGHASEKITLAIYTHTTAQQDIEASRIYNNYLVQ